MSRRNANGDWGYTVRGRKHSMLPLSFLWIREPAPPYFLSFHTLQRMSLPPTSMIFSLGPRISLTPMISHFCFNLSVTIFWIQLFTLNRQIRCLCLLGLLREKIELKVSSFYWAYERTNARKKKKKQFPLAFVDERYLKNDRPRFINS